MRCCPKLRQKHVNIYFIEQNINSNDLAQDLLLKLMQIFDEQDSKDKSIKVRTGINESAKKGVLRTSGKLFGYFYDKDTNSLSIVEKEAEIVRTIFNLYNNGYGIRRIISYLTQSKLFTRSGNPFAKTTIQRILDNEKYAGFNNILKYDTGVVFNKNTYPKVKENYDIEPCDRIPSIISWELFSQCREKMQNNVNHITSKGVYHGISKYGKMLICGSCGCNYSANSDDGKKFYNCAGKKYKKNGCNAPNIYEAQLDECFCHLHEGGMQKLVEQKTKEVTMKKYYVALLEYRKISADLRTKCEEIGVSIAKLKAELENYYELYAITATGKSYLMNVIKEREAELESLNLKLFNLSKPISAIYFEIMKLVEESAKINEYMKEIKIHTLEDVIELVDKIIVSRGSDGKVSLDVVLNYLSNETKYYENIELPEDYDYARTQKIIREALSYAEDL